MRSSYTEINVAEKDLVLAHTFIKESVFLSETFNDSLIKRQQLLQTLMQSETRLSGLPSVLENNLLSSNYQITRLCLIAFLSVVGLECFHHPHFHLFFMLSIKSDPGVFSPERDGKQQRYNPHIRTDQLFVFMLS